MSWQQAARSTQQAAHLGNTTVAGAGRLRPVWTGPPVVFGWPNTPCAQPTQTDCDGGWRARGEPTERPNRRPSTHLGTKKYGHLGRWRSHQRPSSQRSTAASRRRCPAAARPVRGQRSRRASRAAPSPTVLGHPAAAAAAQPPPPPPAAPPSSPAKPSYQRASAGPGRFRGSPAPPTTRSAPAAGRRRYRRQGALVLCYPCQVTLF